MTDSYIRVREEVYDPILNEWRSAEVNTVTVVRARRISNVTGVQRLGSIRVGPGSFLEVTTFEVTGDTDRRLTFTSGGPISEKIVKGLAA